MRSTYVLGIGLALLVLGVYGLATGSGMPYQVITVGLFILAVAVVLVGVWKRRQG